MAVVRAKGLNGRDDFSVWKINLKHFSNMTLDSRLPPNVIRKPVHLIKWHVCKRWNPMVMWFYGRRVQWCACNHAFVLNERLDDFCTHYLGDSMTLCSVRLKAISPTTYHCTFECITHNRKLKTNVIILSANSSDRHVMTECFMSSHRPNSQPTKDQLKCSSALMSRFICLISTSNVEYNWNLEVVTCVLYVVLSSAKCAKSANDFYRPVTVAVTEQCVKQERGLRLFVDSASAVKLIFTTLSGDKSSQQLLAVFVCDAWNVFPYFFIAVRKQFFASKQKRKIWKWHWWATDRKLMKLDALFSRPEDEMFVFWTQKSILFTSLLNSINCKTDAQADVWRWQGQSNKMFTDSLFPCQLVKTFRLIWVEF